MKIFPFKITCQRQICSQLSAEPRKKVATPDIRNQADTRLWHGKKGLLRRQAKTSVNRDADAAAHGYAI